MISTDFAPNESWDDAFISIKLLLQPWFWRKGKELNEAKKQINKVLNTSSLRPHVSLFLSGRSALYCLLKSLNLKKDSHVIVQAFTCEAVILPIIANNLKPIYIDIEPKTYSMDVNNLKNKLTKNAKVLILQHTFGLTPQYRQKILKISQDRGLFIIEDLAHGFDKNIFAKIKDSRSNIFFLFSFGRSKFLSSVFGAAIVTFNRHATKLLNDVEKSLPQPPFWFIIRTLLYKPLAMIIRSTYDLYLGKLFHKLTNFFGLLIPEISRKEKKGEYNLLLNKAYPNAFAILLLHQLKKFEQIQKQRATICQIYNKKISKLSLLRFPLLVENRDLILERARKQNIYLGQWYNQPVAPKGIPLKRLGYQMGCCPVAEKICQQIINLPTNITKNQAEKVIQSLNNLHFNVLKH